MQNALTDYLRHKGRGKGERFRRYVLQMPNHPLFTIPRLCYSQPMTRLALTFLVGVFLFVCGGTGGAWAVTFKDGKVSKDNQVEEPVQNVERKSSGGFLKAPWRLK